MSKDYSRRDFLQTAGGGCLAATLGLYLSACSEDPVSVNEPDDLGDDGNTAGNQSGITVNGNTITLDLTANDTALLKTAGGFLLIRNARTAVINVNGSIRAFTSICTHQQCDVTSFSNNRMNCPCHGSEFKTDGTVARGPAQSGLTRFQVSQSGDTVTITK